MLRYRPMRSNQTGQFVRDGLVAVGQVLHRIHRTGRNGHSFFTACAVDTESRVGLRIQEESLFRGERCQECFT